MTRIKTTTTTRPFVLVAAALMLSLLASPVFAIFPPWMCGGPCAEPCADPTPAPTPGVPLVKPRARLFPVPVRPVFEPPAPPLGGPEMMGPEMIAPQVTGPSSLEPSNSQLPPPAATAQVRHRAPRAAHTHRASVVRPVQSQQARSPRASAPRSVVKNAVEKKTGEKIPVENTSAAHVAWFFAPAEAREPRKRREAVEPLPVRATPLETTPRTRPARRPSTATAWKTASRATMSTHTTTTSRSMTARRTLAAPRTLTDLRAKAIPVSKAASRPQTGLQWRSTDARAGSAYVAQSPRSVLRVNDWSPHRASGNELLDR